MIKPFKVTKRLIADAALYRLISGNDRMFYEHVDAPEQEIEYFLKKYHKQIDVLVNAVYPYLTERAKV